MTAWTTSRSFMDLVMQALELSADERREFLDRAFAGDEERRALAESLVAVSAEEAERFEDLRFELPEELPEPQLAEGDEIEEFTIVRRLGKGGMGVVYLAADTKNRRQVALKVLFGPGVQVSRREHEILASLSSPYIATLHNSGVTADGFPYLVMEHVEGLPLDAYCEKHCLGLKERLRLFLKVCDGVQHAHVNNVVHRDLKPSNILVTADGIPKILDFGVARRLAPDLTLATLTAPEERFLTLAYASPEQVGRQRLNQTTDIYSLGVILCSLLTGRLPYRVATALDLVMAIRTADPVRPSELVLRGPPPARSDRQEGRSLPAIGPFPPADARPLKKRLEGDLDAIVLMTLRKEPDKRYQSVERLALDVDAHLNNKPVSAHQDSLRYRLSKLYRGNRKTVRWASGALLAILFFALSSLLLWTTSERQEKAARQQADRAEQVSTFLVDLFDRSSVWPQGGPTLTPKQFIEQAPSRVERDLKNRPQLRARLLATLGGIQTNLGNFEEADRLLKTALNLQREHLGDSHADTGETLNVLGSLRLREGRYEEAEETLSQSLAIARLHLRENPAVVANRLNSLALLKLRQGDPVASESLAREALLLCEKHPEAAEKYLDNSLQHLAEVFRAQDRFDEAEPILQRVIDLRTRTFGPTHPSTALALSALGWVRHDKGDYAGEERFVRRSVEIMEATLPPDSPDRITETGRLAGALMRLGRLKESEALFRKVLNDYRRVLPESHPLIGGAINNVAAVLVRQGQFEEAAALFRESLPIMEGAHGPHSRHVALALNNLGAVLVHLGEYPKAEEVFEKAVAVSRLAFGDDAVDTALTLKSFANLKLQREHFADARSLVTESLGALEARLSSDHIHIAHARVLLGASLVGLGEFEQGERLLLRGYEQLSQNEVGDRRRTRESLRHIVAMYEAWGKPEEAAAYRRQLFEAAVEEPRHPHP